ncbi:MAG: DnaJ domain-containing protein [Desulfobacteraceae bacterium]|nr:DnaJ domain-containing protein [Desulfobacteraceae bacterium]
MGTIGKIVGGTIGLALGGPLGAIAGAVFGHVFDSNKETGQQEHVRLSMMEETQVVFLVGAFSMLAKLATVDGKVSDAELDTIDSFAVNDLKLTGHSKEVAFNLFNAALNSPASFNDFAMQFYYQFQDQPKILEMMIDIFERVSTADGARSVVAETIILSAVRIFNMDKSRFNRYSSQYVSFEEGSYEILGCKREDSDEKIKKQYRKLVHSYHPDKIESQGLPDEFRKLAEEKFREIQSAYESIKRGRGLG